MALRVGLLRVADRVEDEAGLPGIGCRRPHQVIEVRPVKRDIVGAQQVGDIVGDPDPSLVVFRHALVIHGQADDPGVIFLHERYDTVHADFFHGDGIDDRSGAVADFEPGLDGIGIGGIEGNRQIDLVRNDAGQPLHVIDFFRGIAAGIDVYMGRPGFHLFFRNIPDILLVALPDFFAEFLAGHVDSFCNDGEHSLPSIQ